ncbi:MAG: T9SS type A sorting domain-containing protein, partial [Bacteroidota bacterium]
PLSGEFGIVGYYSAVKDTIWFGTSMGRVYHSTDKGHTFTVSSVPALSGKYVEPSFRTGMHGLVQDKSAGTTGAISETFDGGTTWTAVTTTGPVYATDLLYIPGTENTWVSSGATGNMGSSYSFDGGHSWTDFVGTQGAKYMQMSWVNNHCGWAGGVNVSATENGVYKFIGMLNAPVPAPTNLQAVVLVHQVNLYWNAPTPAPLGYNIYRDGLKLNATVIHSLMYYDIWVASGQYTYCVKAVYNSGESDGACTLVDVGVGIADHRQDQLNVFPNPVSGRMCVFTGIDCNYSMLDATGHEVKTGILNSPKTTIDLGDLPAGVYLIRIPSSGTHRKVIVVK